MSESKAASKKKQVQRTASDIFAQFRQTQLQEFKEAFSFIDNNKDGIIDKNDLVATWDALGRVYPDNDLQSMLAESPAPLNFTMFLRLIATKISGSDGTDVLKQAFETFDPDQTGKVNVEVLKKSLKTFGEKLSDEEIELAMKEAPLDSKGNIDIMRYCQTISGQEEEEQ